MAKGGKKKGTRQERKMNKLDKRTDAAWDTAMMELTAPGLERVAPQPEPEPEPMTEADELEAAVEQGMEMWVVLEDRTVREYPQESSKKLGTIRTNAKVVLLETARDGRGKQRLKVKGGGLEGWVSKDTSKGRVAVVLHRGASAATRQSVDLRALVEAEQRHRPVLKPTGSAVSETPQTALTGEREGRCRGCCCCRRRRPLASSSSAAP